MKKLLILLSICSVTSAYAADTEWWFKDTICRPNTNKCYPSMGIGYDAGYWDAESNCWGMKYVCGEAIEKSSGDNKNLLMGNEIVYYQNKYTDFDFSQLNTASRCFGARKTKDNGSKAMINGEYVKVYCPGVLDSDAITVTNGEITMNYKGMGQPTCKNLADNGWLNVLNNNKCYGKKYSTSDYFIECDNAQVTNTRVIVLNGAKNYVTNTDGVSTSKYPTKIGDSNTIFDTMLSTAQKNRNEKFVIEKKTTLSVPK